MVVEITKTDISLMVESVLRNILNEGIEYSPSLNGKINFKINTRKDDRGNIDADTRVFGTKNDILHGDNTARMKSLTDWYSENQPKMDAYKKLMTIITNKQDPYSMIESGELSDNPNMTKWILAYKNGSKTLNELYAWAQKMYDINSIKSSMASNKINRLGSLDDNDVTFRYDIAKIPDTNVDVISLFTMSDFNFSDAIKHGKLRQNGTTDKILGINKNDREYDNTLVKRKGKGTLRKIDVTYDDQMLPDVMNNFSLNNDTYPTDNRHFKKQYGYGDKNYTTVTQFMDKSIVYASMILKKIGFIPDVIVAPPSSSKYNDYYCTNLSRKIGSPYVKDFFKRNVINVKIDENSMIKDGLSQTEIFELKEEVRKSITKELSLVITQPFANFVQQNSSVFSNIKTGTGEFYPLQAVSDAVRQLGINELTSTMNSNMVLVAKQITKQAQSPIKDSIAEQRIKEIINSLVRGYSQAKQESSKLLIAYYNQLISENGININVASKKFKITDFEKRYRKYLNNVYLVADANLNQYGQLLSRYANGKFLIFDEDLNSGATLKLSIDALMDKLPAKNSDQIKCLVNAFSEGGL